jgi:hypothetical protein
VGALIGDLLPLAAGIALSPVPVIATVLVLLAPGVRPTSSAYAPGWVAGIVAVTVPALLVVGAIDGDPDEGSSDAGGWIRIALGVLLLVAAWRQWSGRPRAEPEEPAPRARGGQRDVT